MKIIFLIILVVILISGCVQSIPKNIDECPTKEIENYLNSAQESNVVIKGLYYYDYSGAINFFVYKDNIDDWEICHFLEASCKLGYKQGQNVNYYYCEPSVWRFFYPNIFCIKKIIVTPNGNIEKIIVECVDNFITDKNMKIININCYTPNTTENTGC